MRQEEEALIPPTLQMMPVADNLGVAWTEEWDEVLNLAGFDQGNVSTYNYDPNSESGSSSRRRRSSGSENLWLLASSAFGTPIFFLQGSWFVNQKSLSLSLELLPIAYKLEQNGGR
ncbi:hypothetical protein LIER_28251 [Lithospermum erythrorhizon]|uniref:Uncharacterized protein n=1 Tax=Lithospermum erythrorhizon TaxID=34254 RepID=A0AAV3RF26_LITER